MAAVEAVREIVRNALALAPGVSDDRRRRILSLLDGDNDRALVTEGDAAALLGVSKSQLRQWRMKGELYGQQFPFSVFPVPAADGREHWRYDRNEVAEVIEQRMVRPARNKQKGGAR
jgi:hypothetical protein